MGWGRQRHRVTGCLRRSLHIPFREFFGKTLGVVKNGTLSPHRAHPTRWPSVSLGEGSGSHIRASASPRHEVSPRFASLSCPTFLCPGFARLGRASLRD